MLVWQEVELRSAEQEQVEGVHREVEKSYGVEINCRFMLGTLSWRLEGKLCVVRRIGCWLQSLSCSNIEGK